MTQKYWITNCLFTNPAAAMKSILRRARNVIFDNLTLSLVICKDKIANIALARNLVIDPRASSRP